MNLLLDFILIGKKSPIFVSTKIFPQNFLSNGSEISFVKLEFLLSPNKYPVYNHN